MTGTGLPKHRFSPQKYCETQKSLALVPGNTNLLRTHLLRMHRMQHEHNNNNNPAFIDINKLQERTEPAIKVENVVGHFEIVPHSQFEGQLTQQSTLPFVKKEEFSDVKLEDIKVEKDGEEKYDGGQLSTASAGASAVNAHVVNELRKVLESRKKLGQGESRDNQHDQDEEEDMDIASDSQQEETMDPDESVLEKRRQRRRERNRLAAQRCRRKKREQAITTEQEVGILETTNKELKHKVQRLQFERDTLHALIRKHLPRCISNEEPTNTSNQESASKKNDQQVPVKQRNALVTEASQNTNVKCNTATWTVTSPTQTVSVAKSTMDEIKFGERSESSQIPQVVPTVPAGTGAAGVIPGVPGPVAGVNNLIWPYLLPLQVAQQQQQVATSHVIPVQPGSVPVDVATATLEAAKNLLSWQNMVQAQLPTVTVAAHNVSPSQSSPLAQPTTSNTFPDNLDQPLVIDFKPENNCKDNDKRTEQ